MQQTAFAEDRVAARFSRLMNASTSPLGYLTDPPLVALMTGIDLLLFLGALRLEASPVVIEALAVFAATPLLVAVAVSVLLRGARAEVVAWLGALPFPVENMNALLNGVGDALELSFADAVPPVKELNAALDAVSPDAFVTRAAELDGGGEEPASRGMEVRIGVVESPRNPGKSNYQRFVRVRALVEQVLVPLHARCPLREVRVK